MHLPELNVRCDATVDQFPLFSTAGFMAYVVVLKAQYRMHPDGSLGFEPGATIRPVHEPWPDDDTGASVMLPEDVVFRKPSTDVVVSGSATSTEAVSRLNVMVRLGPVERSLQVSGPRTWYRTAGGCRLSDPAPFTRCRLRWEQAFGGMDLSNPDAPMIEWRNPVGCGLAANPAILDGKPGPRIEEPRDLITSHRSRPKPAGVAPVGPQFEPRKSHAGTLDDAWTRERMPLMPLDFDERFYQVAPSELITPDYLRGGETLELLHIGRPGARRYGLPRRRFAVQSHVDGREAEEHVPQLDTVVVRADDDLLELTWRVPVIAPARTTLLRAIDVFEKKFVA